MGNEGRDNVNGVGLVEDESILIFQAWALAEFCQRPEGLIDEGNVVLIDEEPNEARTPSIRIKDTIQEYESLGDEVIGGFISLLTKESLNGQRSK